MDPSAIDPRLLDGSRLLARLALCEARLQDDARFPWIVLIPLRAGKQELEDLAAEDRALLLDEILAAGAAVRAVGAALGRPVEKLNVAALGNVTPQLHIHVVGRRADDAAWPGPVWGVGQAHALPGQAMALATTAAKAALGA